MSSTTRCSPGRPPPGEFNTTVMLYFAQTRTVPIVVLFRVMGADEEALV